MQRGRLTGFVAGAITFVRSTGLRDSAERDMGGLRAVLVQLAQIMMVLVIIAGVVIGFVAGGYGQVGMISALRMGVSPVQLSGSGFSVVFALIGAVAGFVVSALAMSTLAILLDIRLALMRIAARGGF